MGYFVIRRLFWAVFLFLVATLVTYVIFFVIPTNPAELAAGKAAKPEIVAHIRHELHLDLPIYQQYWLFLWNMLRHASLGYSFRFGTSVRWVVAQDAPVTASLVFGGAVLLAPARDPDRDHLGAEAAVDSRPHHDGRRPGRRLGAGGLDRPDPRLHLRFQARRHADRRLLQLLPQSHGSESVPARGGGRTT